MVNVTDNEGKINLFGIPVKKCEQHYRIDASRNTRNDRTPRFDQLMGNAELCNVGKKTVRFARKMHR
jgi:hypothetical protein